MQTVVTHSGNFHPDDVLAIATLQLYLGKEKMNVIRTRDEAVISQADWVIDVGEVYDVSAKRFDHHQKGSPVRENGIPYAAFGLIWKELGELVGGSTAVADSIEKRLAQPIDAGDNGFNLYEINDNEVTPFELFSVINSFRPVKGSGDDIDAAFMAAVDFARGLLERLIRLAAAEEKLQATARAGYEAAADKTILVFDEPVERHSFIQYPEVKVIVYRSESGEHDAWKATVIPKTYNSFASRADFPAEWGGHRDEELAEISGIPDAIFCHNGRFLFVAKSQAGALVAAKKAV